MSSNIPIPFSRRTTASVAVFACIFIASPQGIQAQIALSVPTISALALSYGQLTNLYPTLIHQDVANQKAVLDVAITSAVSIVSALKTTLGTITALTGDQQFQLQHVQIVVADALTNLENALAAGGD